MAKCRCGECVMAKCQHGEGGYGQVSVWREVIWPSVSMGRGDMAKCRYGEG